MKLAELATQLGAELHGDGSVEITGVRGIEEASPSEITFVANVVWSYTHPQPVRSTSVKTPYAAASSAALRNSSVAPTLGQSKIPVTLKEVTPWSWPASAVKLFGVSAAFFWAGGLISIVLNFPSLRFPFPFGYEIFLVPFGSLWLAAGVPFALFAAITADSRWDVEQE